MVGRAAFAYATSLDDGCDVNKQKKFKSELLLGFTLAAKSFSSQLKLSRLYVTKEFTYNFSKFCTWRFLKWFVVFAWLWTVLTGIGVEIAKHTFSLDNIKISRICDQGREQFFLWQRSPLFSLLRTQPNNLRIFVWHHTSVSHASRILTLDASKWAVSRLCFNLKRTQCVWTLPHWVESHTVLT